MFAHKKDEENAMKMFLLKTLELPFPLGRKKMQIYVLVVSTLAADDKDFFFQQFFLSCSFALVVYKY